MRCRRHDAERARTRMANHLYAVEDYVSAIPAPELEEGAPGGLLGSESAESDAEDAATFV